MTTMPLHSHPVLACAESIAAALDDVAEVNPVYMTAAEKAEALRALARDEARLADLRLRVLAASDDVAEQAACKDVGIWLAHETNTDHGVAHAEMHLARSLDARWQHVAAGMREGVVSAHQARVIAEALDRVVDDALPRLTDLAAEERADLLDRAEAELVARAREFKPKELRRLGRRILEAVAPEIFEEAEAARIAEEEQRAWRQASARFTPAGDGTTKVNLRLPDSSAVRLRTYLEAYTAPRNRHGEPGEADRIPTARKLGQAFCALLEHLDPARLPEHNGDATTLMVTIDLKSLMTGLGYAELLDGTQISAGEARRLACQSRIVPAVLGGNSEVLDLGRADRLFRPAQRKAIRLRDRRCRAEGCTVPATWCEIHHLRAWRDGGPTDLANGICLCFWHHRRVDDARYEVEHRTETHELRITRRRRQ